MSTAKSVNRRKPRSCKSRRARHVPEKTLREVASELGGAMALQDVRAIEGALVLAGAATPVDFGRRIEPINGPGRTISGRLDALEAAKVDVPKLLVSIGEAHGQVSGLRERLEACEATLAIFIQQIGTLPTDVAKRLQRNPITDRLDPFRATCPECERPYWRNSVTWLSAADAIRLSEDMWPLFEDLRRAAGGDMETLRDILVNATNALTERDKLVRALDFQRERVQHVTAANDQLETFKTGALEFKQSLRELFHIHPDSEPLPFLRILADRDSRHLDEIRELKDFRHRVAVASRISETAGVDIPDGIKLRLQKLEAHEQIISNFRVTLEGAQRNSSHNAREAHALSSQIEVMRSDLVEAVGGTLAYGNLSFDELLLMVAAQFERGTDKPAHTIGQLAHRIALQDNELERLREQLHDADTGHNLDRVRELAAAGTPLIEIPRADGVTSGKAEDWNES